MEELWKFQRLRKAAWKAQAATVDTIHCFEQFHFSSLNVKWTLSTAGWPTTAQERMIYRWVAPHTLYAASIIQQSSLQIDRPSLDCQRHPCQTIGSSIQAASRRKAALSRRLTVGELRGSTKAQYELKRINTVYWDSYSPALPMRFIASLTFLITYVQKWSDVDHVNASTDLYCLDRKTTPMLSWH